MRRPKKRIYKLRFHLGRGINYQKWQLSTNIKGETPQYYDPSKYQIYIRDGKLRNYPRIAHGIFCGKNKTVCAWIESPSIFPDKIEYEFGDELVPESSLNPCQLFYNPRVHPYWHNTLSHNLDGLTYQSIVTYGRKVFALFPSSPSDNHRKNNQEENY